MKEFINSQLGVYISMIVLYLLAAIALRVIHSGIKRIETWATNHMSQQDAVKVNDLLDMIDHLAETAVQDANSRMVIDLKSHDLFTKATADSVKQAVVADVMKNLGPLQDKAITSLGPLESIISQAVEKYVLHHKPLVNQYVQNAKGKSTDTTQRKSPSPEYSPVQTA
ncbi:hypothetical protein LSG31_11610 [Fodinisporobacter ferrooxydans]|uniref:DUF948 domain-containing protein n=1 Tax=Fodinisporobacter ferrooxydans TaxID=2901836 RepID=A0ABY4CDI3_9BACL|nr:hypothetical protein LSG31_11610 [Alicyclobacillaceae bacterium MYW30-H2]